MKIYDLSHKLSNQTPVYPGTMPPSFKPAASLEKEGYKETRIDINSHLGTHIDAPFHMLEKGKSLDELPVESFMGKALIIRVPEETTTIEKSLLEDSGDLIKDTEFVLFNTGWSKYWGSDKYFRDFPVLSASAVDYLLSFNLKGVGFDTISADTVESQEYELHKVIMNRDLIIIENLLFPENLDRVKGYFFCLPLPFQKADGSPVRAIIMAETI